MPTSSRSPVAPLWNRTLFSRCGISIERVISRAPGGRGKADEVVSYYKFYIFRKKEPHLQGTALLIYNKN